MQDIFFTESDEAPLPPEEVRIRLLDAVLRPDGRRLDVRTEITPFLKRPNFEIVVRNNSGEVSANLSVVEAVETSMEFTMHLHEKEPIGTYLLEMQLFYSDLEANEPADGEEIPSAEILRKSKLTVDKRQIEFQI
jgi:hypothetical protein